MASLNKTMLSHDYNSSHSTNSVRRDWPANLSIISSAVIGMSLCKYNKVNPASLSSLMVVRRWFFSNLKEEKVRSGVAVVTGRVAAILRSLLMLGKKSSLQKGRLPIAVFGRSPAATFDHFCFHNSNSASTCVWLSMN